jgi:hypothetical protein
MFSNELVLKNKFDYFILDRLNITRIEIEVHLNNVKESQVFLPLAPPFSDFNKNVSKL